MVFADYDDRASSFPLQTCAQANLVCAIWPEVQVYFITKGSLWVANKQFSNVNNDYEMTLNANSEVEQVPEDAASIQMPAMKYKFVKINALGPYVNGKELVGMSLYSPA